MVSHELVNVETVSGLIEAEILRGLLEAAGVIVELSHEAALSAYAVGVGRLAGVEVMVRADQEALAGQVLEEYRSGALDAPDPPTTTSTDASPRPYGCVNHPHQRIDRHPPDPTSQCRCAPVRPVAPTRPIVCPGSTRSPGATTISDWYA